MLVVVLALVASNNSIIAVGGWGIIESFEGVWGTCVGDWEGEGEETCIIFFALFFLTWEWGHRENFGRVRRVEGCDDGLMHVLL